MDKNIKLAGLGGVFMFWRSQPLFCLLIHWLLTTVFVTAGVIALSVDANAETMRVANLGSYSSLNLRSAPTASSRVIDRMPKGAMDLYWTGNQVVNGSTLWYEIDFQGQIGWASAAYLEPYRKTRSFDGYAPYSPYLVSPEYGLPPTSSINVYGSGEYYFDGDSLGPALFGLAVGGIFGAAIASLSTDDGQVLVSPPVPAPTPKPRRFELNCSGDRVSFIYQRETGEIDLTINGRHLIGSATDRASDGPESFAITFTTQRSDGTLFVENIYREGKNASLYWGGRRNQGLYKLNCYREPVW